MSVGELIEQLKQYDPAIEVKIKSRGMFDRERETDVAGVTIKRNSRYRVILESFVQLTHRA